MLTLFGRRYSNCDGISRRAFLTAGAAGMVGLSLPDLLRAEAKAGIGKSNKAIINVHLDGGPPQMDMIDMKPNAPAEIRGEFGPISTCLSGVQISELMPKTAAIADRFVFLRSLVGAAGRHDAFQCQSGFQMQDLQGIGGRPAMGCILTHLLGSASDPAPTFVDLMQGRPLVRNSARPGFLGPSFTPFRPDMSSMFRRELEDAMKGELARLGKNHTTSLKLSGGLDTTRLNTRASLLGALDKMRRRVDASGMMDAMDRFHQQAASILTSGAFADALDLEKEDPRMVERYTPKAKIDGRHVTSDEPIAARKFLLARRLVEVGVRCVSITISDFDTHSKNFPRCRQVVPILDHGIHALITDLEERGMLDDVTIVLWGEFGRTPTVNKNGGRDHWPRVSMGMMAGGGMKTGLVLGSTDRTAGTAVTRPIHYQDVMATMYHNIGIDARTTTVTDPTGRPQYLLDQGEPIREVV